MLLIVLFEVDKTGFADKGDKGVFVRVFVGMNRYMKIYSLIKGVDE